MVRSNRRFLLKDYPLDDNNTNDSSESDDANVDADMIVMLAALVCALVAALLLNSIIHIYLRRRHESMEAAATNAQGLGLEKHVLKKIPVAVFKSRTSGSSSATECSICLGDFVDGEKVRALPECNHEFHVKCVDKWLNDHTSCPNCRRSLVPPKVVDGRDQTAMLGRGGMVMI